MSDKDIPVSPAGDGESKLTAGDIKFFTAMFKYLPKNIEMDWDEFAQEMGFKDGRIAKVRLHALTYLHTMFQDALRNDKITLYRVRFLI